MEINIQQAMEMEMFSYSGEWSLLQFAHAASSRKAEILMS